jgi:Protein of unknown function (DUF4019)
MKRATTFWTIVLSIFAVSSCAAEDKHADEAAEAAAIVWLSLVDAGSYAQSWAAASARFRQAVPQEQWESKAAVASPVTTSSSDAKRATIRSIQSSP